jgi:hypothetical protein
MSTKDNSINNESSRELEPEQDNDIIEHEKYTIQNMILTGIISCIYILLISKFAELISLDFNDEKNSIGTYVMIIYFVTIAGIVFTYLFFKNDNIPNSIMKYSLNISNTILMMYTVINHWDHLDEYAKCTLLVSTFIGIVYYLYKSY